MNVIVGKEPLVCNVPVKDYIDTTFNARRFELYEMTAASKNSFLVNGVGMPQKARVKTTEVHGPGCEGVLLDGTGDMVAGSAVTAYGRAVIMIEKSAILVIDRMVLEHVGLAESRFHTYEKLSVQKRSATIKGRESSLHLAFASSVPAVLKMAEGFPAIPACPTDRIIRWMTTGKHHAVTLATLMTPGGKGRVTVKAEGLAIRAVGPGYNLSLRFADGKGLDLRVV